MRTLYDMGVLSLEGHKIHIDDASMNTLPKCPEAIFVFSREELETYLRTVWAAARERYPYGERGFVHESYDDYKKSLEK